MQMYRDHLETKDNYSAWIRESMEEKLQREGDSKFIDIKIQEHKQEIQRLQGLKKTKPSNEKEIHELLAYHSMNYKENAPHRSEAQRLRFIEKSILPTLKKLGYQGSPQEIDETLLNWPEEK